MTIFANRRRITGAGIVLLVGCLALLYWLFRPDPRLARAQELSRQLTGDAARALTEAQRREVRQELRQQMERLTPEQRRALGKERRKVFEDQVARFSTLSKEDQTAFLDNQINRMEEARRRWQQENANGNNAGFPRSSGRSNDPDERDRRRRDRLDETTPEQRAQFTAFFQALRERRLQRGGSGGGWGGGR
jgi:hypothetical protein